MSGSQRGVELRNGEIRDFQSLVEGLGQLTINSHDVSIPIDGPYTRTYVVNKILQPGLDDQQVLRKIDENHDCFQLPILQEFRRRHEIPETPWDNFVRLLCGYRDMPFIILQNPTNAHDLEYEEMVKCPTLVWISEVLAKIGLKLEDVPIIDTCILLSKNDLARYGTQRWAVVEESYNVMERVIDSLRPNVVISCQCATIGRRDWYQKPEYNRWKPAQHEFARALCSSQAMMKRGGAKLIQLQSHRIWMVNGIHPVRLSYMSHRPGEKMILETALKRVFEDVFVPCRSWLHERTRSSQGRSDRAGAQLAVRQNRGGPAPQVDATRRKNTVVLTTEIEVVKCVEGADKEAAADGITSLLK